MAPTEPLRGTDPTTPTEMAHAWVHAWNIPTAEAFVDLFADDGEYYDVTFGVRRQGHELIGMHHQIWRSAVPDFTMTLEKTHAGADFVVLEAIGRGTFSGSDLGGGLVKATMKPFEGRAAAILTLTGDLKIQTCHEYYERAVMPGGAETPFGQR